MPYGSEKKAEAFDKQLLEIELKIKKHRAKIKELKAREKSLLEAREKDQLDTLGEIVGAYGKPLR